MLDIAIKGIGLGLFLSLLIGPVFFALIETSLKRGFIASFFFDLGILAGDTLLIFIAYQSTTSFEITDTVIEYLKVIGGITFITYGLIKLLTRKPTKQDQPVIMVESEHFLRSMTRGFILNFANPSVLLYWLGVVVLAVSKYPSSTDATAFFIFILGTLFITDMGKAYLAKKLRGFLNQKVLNKLSLIVGAVFLVFGCVLLVEAKNVLI